MSVTLQFVSLRGGSFDGQIAQAPPPPGALRLGAKSDDEEWSELYLYELGEVVTDPRYGAIPVMRYMSRDQSI